jgi:hypothetical protein
MMWKRIHQKAANKRASQVLEVRAKPMSIPTATKTAIVLIGIALYHRKIGAGTDFSCPLNAAGSIPSGHESGGFSAGIGRMRSDAFFHCRQWKKWQGVPVAKSDAPKEELEQQRSELRNGLTDMQRLFLFGKLSGLNDKDAAIAAGYSVSVAENTKQRIWKPRVRAEFERLQRSIKK